ncbi:MAG: hypothetical protein MEQ07_10955 [Aquimonas sp.]|nr:hypothetical protein [Aquimonas sp.]
MVNLAIFHTTLPQYLRESAGEADQKNLQIVLSGERKEQLLAAAGNIKVDALVVDLGLLGEQPETALRELEQAFKPELCLIVYSFAKWSLIEALRGPGRQLLRAPVSARSLRSSMIGLIVKHLASGAAAPPSAAAAAETTLLRLEQQPPMRRYDDLQLAALQDVRSLVDCECPNQVADLVLALTAFETYSAQCQNKNEKDAQIHRMLARVTGHARSAMEYALKELCAYENIDPVALVRRSAQGG